MLGIGMIFALFFDSVLNVDFGQENTDASQNWQVINDGVMGGMSQGRAHLKENSLLFMGKISLENNGGFSSLRSPFKRFDLSGKEKVVIRYRNSGYPMAFSMETSRQWFQPNYKYSLKDQSGKWVEERIPLKDFYAYRIGRRLDRKLASQTLPKIIRVGFISDGKKAGPFELEVDYIRFE